MPGKPLVQMETLYQLHGPALLGYLERAFGSRHSAEDLLQETFVHALRHHERCANADSPRAFLFGIARNVGLAACRGKLLRTNADLLNEGAPGGGTKTASQIFDPAIADMREAISGLPLNLRETLELRVREELTYEEIAVVLQIPLGTVRSRLHAAMRLLRDQLTKEPP